MSEIMLAETPPMGWNSWNRFGHNVDENVMRAAAEAMASNGMKDVGYEYVVIDDCWSRKSGRDSNGDLVADPERFPSGMKALADHIHGLGLKFGLYSDAAELTCAKWPGSFGFEEQDAALFASWGVDFLKYDYCHAPAEQHVAIERYTAMGQALENCGRPILFSACEWGGRAPWTWAKEAGAHMWRVTGDVVDVFSGQADWGGLGIEQALDRGAHLHEYAGPGGWNDMDMLVVGIKGTGGNGSGCTDEEYRLHMSMWVILASPLMAGCELTTIDPFSADTLMNPEVIAVNQDALGQQGYLAAKSKSLEIWHKPLYDDSTVVCLVNRGTSSEEIEVNLDDFEFEDETPKPVRDLWARRDVGELKHEYTREVAPHSAVLLKIG